MKKLFNFILIIALLIAVFVPHSALATDWTEKQANKNVSEGSYNAQAIAYTGSYSRMSAQTFIAVSDYYLSNISLYMKRVGNPTGTYRVGIKATTGTMPDEVPTGDYLAYEDVSFASISTSFSWVGITFYGTYANIVAGNGYAIIIEPLTSISNDSNYIEWRGTFQDANPVIGQIKYDLSPSSQWVTDVGGYPLGDLLYIIYGTSANFGITVTTSNPTIKEAVSGNFTASFYVFTSNATDNATAILVASIYTDFSHDISGDSWYSSPITLSKRVVGTDNKTFEFMTNTSPSIHPPSGELLPNTYYYYQGRAKIDGVVYYSGVDYFLTTESGFPNKPSVNITSIKDVSSGSNQPYTFEVNAKINSNNTTVNIISQGFDLSLSSSGGGLDPPVYSYKVNSVSYDNTYSLLFTLSTLSSYDGSTIYLRAFIYTDFYGDIYSNIVPFNPISSIGITPPGIVKQTNDIFKNFKASLGLTGIMGSWAFLGILLLIVAIIFGCVMFSAQDSTTRTCIAVIWMLISVAILGAFIFTGELGIWPVIIMVGGVVVFVIMLISVKLSGSGGNV